MRKLCALILFLLIAVPVLGDTQDTVVFRAAMAPENEIPAISAPGNVGVATITVRVTRDTAGNINAATVIFDIDYTVPTMTTFTGLHIHNAMPGTSGNVVINTGISGNNPVIANNVGHITRVVNYTSTDADGLKYVSGLLETPENYYVNIHSTTNGSGLMRAPLLRTSLTLRPRMTTDQETPANTADAEGAATIQVSVNRNNAGAITSGSVTFDVDYRIPANSIITGLHIHNGAAGVAGPIVIDSGVNATTRAISTATGRGNIFRITDINNSNTAGLATLTSLMNDPTPFYVNLHTTQFTGGLIRGQLSRDTYAFFNLMTQAEENPPTNIPAVADSMTIVKVTRDPLTGNIVSGSVGFNVAYSGFDPQTTFSGLHIHNGPIGVNASVVINTGINGTNNAVISETGTGSVNREVTIDAITSTSSNAAITTNNSLRGLLQNPELYYVNIHSIPNFAGGAIRSQLAKETYHFRANMSPANETPPITATASATGWITVKISRDANGVINGGQVTFDVDAVGNKPTTYTGLHIHGGAAGVPGGVVINTGLNGTTNSISSDTGTLNITRVVNIDPDVSTQMAMLSTLINNPDQAYVNIHTTEFGSGVARSQMLPVVNYVPQTAGGGDWISSITITNPSTTSSVQGIIDSYQSSGSAMPSAIVDPNISFLIPPGGSTTINLHNKGDLTSGFARVYTSGNATVSAAYNFPAFPSTAVAVPGTGSTIEIPVAVAHDKNTGIALYALTSGQLILTLRDNGFGVAFGNRVIDVTAGQHIAAFISELMPDVTMPQYNGKLIIESRTSTASAGQVSGIALQFNGVVAPVVVSVIQ